MNATVAMDKRFDEEDEDEEEAEDEEEEEEDDKVKYSEAFRNLVLAFRRRTFTQRGVRSDGPRVRLEERGVDRGGGRGGRGGRGGGDGGQEPEVDGADGRGGGQVPRLPDLEPGPQGQEGEVQDGGPRAVREAPPGAGPVRRGAGRRGHLPQGSSLQRPPARGLAHHRVVPQRVLVLRPASRRDP